MAMQENYFKEILMKQDFSRRHIITAQQERLFQKLLIAILSQILKTDNIIKNLV